MKYTLSFLLFICFSIQSIKAQPSINLENIWKDYKYTPNRVPGFNFMNDGKHYSRIEDNNIEKYDLTTGQKVSTIINGSDLKGKAGFNGKIGSYTFSENENLIVIESESEAIYRRSSKAYFYIYNRISQELISIYEEDKISYATLSPDGSKVAYVWKNDIYLYDLSNETTIPITNDGKKNAIINGSTDWVYEEEFGYAKAFFWSPDGNKIAFQKFDETLVPEFTMTNYRNELYPEYVTFKYPKVGETNAVVSVHIYDIIKDKTLDLNLDGKAEFYVPRLKWTLDPNNLFVYKLNRHQNNLNVISAHAETGQLKTVINETNKYYIDISDDITFLKNGKNFIWSSEKSGFNHLYLYSLEGKEKAALTSGEFDVTNFYGYDEKHKCLFYQAAEKSPLVRNIYTVNLRGKNKKELTPLEGTNNAQFSSTFDYYINTYSNLNTPATYNVYDRKNKLVRSLESNEKLRNIQKEEKTIPLEFFNFKTSDNLSLNGWMLKPQNFDPSKKYPVFMYLYGGPGSQQVTDSWKGQNYWWFQMLAQQGYLIACVDNRGTGARGEEFKKVTYKQLGHYETKDQIEAAQYLGSLSYTDASRIGIFGWSYGGYMSSLCLLKGNDVFKSAIAVAPVINWRWYDTVYTERFMRTEEENPDGYANNSPINFADKLKGNYLLIHGMGDDNVHFQNSVEMANALIRENKQFDTYYYPNRNHGIYGNNARLHLYTKMTDFILNKI